MGEWRECKLGDVVQTNVNSLSSAYPYTDILYLDTGSITSGELGSYQKMPLAEAPSRAKRLVKDGDIVYSTVRPIQRHYGFIKNPPLNLVVSTGFAVIETLEGLADPLFIYNLLASNDVVELLDSIAEGSTSAYPSLKPSDIESLDILLPPLPEQKSIAEVLSSLDDKIDLLHRQNRTLLGMAEAVFRGWFVEGAQPDWKEEELGDVAQLSAGGDKPDVFSPTISEECSIPIYSNGIDNNGLYGYTDSPKIIEESVTVSARGTIGFVCLREEPYVPIVRLVSVIPDASILSAKYIYHWLKLANISGTGTTQEQLTVPDFKKTKILIPDKIMMEKFMIIVDPFYVSMSNNRKQIRTLESLRNTLLPKLMSGEVRLVG